MFRIIDLTGLAGAYATRLFAEEGHEVIRVENPDGEPLRQLPPFLGEKQDLENSAYHQFLNANKKSLALDLKSSLGQRVFLDLVRDADALVADLPLPVEEQLIFQKNPKLIFTKIEDDAPEICATARSGLMFLTGQPHQAPMMLGGHVSYLAVGIYIAVATASAALVGKNSGRCVIATVSVREALESFVEQAMVEYSFSGTITERRGSKGAITAISGALPCKNGYWVISQIHRPGRWEKFMEWVHDPELSTDASLQDEENQYRRRDFILNRLETWAKGFTNTELVEEAQKRHFPASPVTTPLDLVDDPQLIARGFLRKMNHPQYGDINFPHGAIASVLGRSLKPAPTLGEHNAEILRRLGYSTTEAEAPSAIVKK